MSLGRELLRCWLVMVHVSSTGSRAAGAFNALEELTFDPPLCNLLMAERTYVECMFPDSLLKELNTDTSKPFWGITLPAGNTSGEVLTFVSTILDCLNNTVPGIVMNLTSPNCQSHILTNITTFSKEFREIQWMYGGRRALEVPAQCPKQVTACDHYCQKRNGLRILHYTKSWVQTFASCGDFEASAAA